MRLQVVAVLLSGFVASCAGVQVQRVTSPNQPGIRYWRPAPYLALVETRTDKAVICEAKPFMLPDKTEEYAITINAGLGSVKATPTLDDGWNLTSLDAEADSKTADNLTALATLLKTGFDARAALARPATAQAAPACRGLYRVDYDAAGRFSGFTPVGL